MCFLTTFFFFFLLLPLLWVYSRGHASQVCSFDFSPFHESHFISATAEGELKYYILPDTVTKTDTSNCEWTQQFSSKILKVQFHPYVQDVIVVALWNGKYTYIIYNNITT